MVLAAPKLDPGSAIPKYKPNSVFPMENNKDVTMAPVHTDFHLISTSGKTLNITANSKATIPILSRKFTTSINRYISSPKLRVIKWLTPEIKEDKINEISNRKAITRIKPKELALSIKSLVILLSGFASTSQR